MKPQKIFLIFSEKEDFSTNNIIDWCMYKDIPYIRINSDYNVNILKVSMNEIVFKFGENIVSSENIGAVWFRRGWLWAEYIAPEVISQYLPSLKGWALHEGRVLSTYVNRFLRENFRSLGNFEEEDINKLSVLKAATSVGLEIPPTAIVTSRDELRQFKLAHGAIISKPIRAIIQRINPDTLESFSTLTSIVDDDIIDLLPEHFPPSLIQKAISKKYELRIFYLAGEMYAMALFSQLDNKTSVDFRNYNYVKKARWIPFNISLALKNIIINLMTKINLDTGSIDIIVTPELKYIFLEVNPVGQYGMVSHNCNYYLDGKIIDYLWQN